jgi:hypothetical protein
MAELFSPQFCYLNNKTIITLNVLLVLNIRNN